MVVSIRSLGLNGIQGYCVQAECFLSGGLPNFDVVGLPDAAVREARERVRAAIKNCGAKFPVSRITVNLAPAGQKKAGTVYDLPIFVGILAASEAIPLPSPESAFIGELSLTGALRGITGVLPMAMAAIQNGVKELYVPAENAAEATLAGNLTVYGVTDVSALLAHLRGEALILPTPTWTPVALEEDYLDFKDVMGQTQVKRAMEIAAAGGHNILLIGAPGSGKSMLAKRLPSILPPLTSQEALDTSAIWSVAGLTDPEEPLLTRRPFRAPHHTASATALAGGGPQMRPGEISLSHNGVLFLDELPEFHRDVLETLRQPLEDGEVTVSRAGGTLHLPARFQLVCAMNPCRCGWWGHPSGRCRCSARDMERYVEKISGPLLDRIDLHVHVPSVDYDMMRRKTEAESSQAVKERVDAAREMQKKRYQGTSTTCNAYMTPAQLKEFCVLDQEGDKLMENAFLQMGFTARSHDRILRVARTIADLEGEEKIGAVHLSEAVQYRNTDILKG